MRLKYDTMKNGQLGDQLLRYIDGEVLETPHNVAEFDALVREVIRRLKEGPERQFRKAKIGDAERPRFANRRRCGR